MLAKNWIQTIDRSIAVQEGAIDCKVVKELKELRSCGIKINILQF